MKPHKLQTGAIALFCALAASAFARPLDFRELSLLVRAHEPDSSIVSIASERKLVRPLTAPQEATLRSQGASDSLLRSLHNSNLVLSPTETAVFEATNSAPPTPRAPDRSREKVQIIDIDADQPINFSVWDGPDIELTFRGRDIVETGRGEVEMTQPAGSAVHYATYHGVRVPGWEPVDPAYTSIAAHTFTRPLHIDWRNPVTINEVPYLLYPIYSARGASLYFIGRTSDDTVRVAVITR